MLCKLYHKVRDYFRTMQQLRRLQADLREVLSIQEATIKVLNKTVGWLEIVQQEFHDAGIHNMAVLLCHAGGKVTVSKDMVDMIQNFKGQIDIDVNSTAADTVTMTLSMTPSAKG